MGVYWFPIGLAIFGTLSYTLLSWLIHIRKRLHQQGILNWDERVSWIELLRRTRRL